MPDIPGLNADVFFGDAEQQLPDWRDATETESEGSEDLDDDAPLSEDERKALASMLGFDPAEIDE